MAVEILTVKEIAKEMHVKVSKVHEYRQAGLIRMFRTGSGYMATAKEFDRFLDMLTEGEADLSTPEKIILTGRALKKEPVGAGSQKKGFYG